MVGCGKQSNLTSIPGNNALLYGSDWGLKRRTLSVLDLDNLHTYNISDPSQSDDYKFFNSSRTLMISYLRGKYGDIGIYDYTKKISLHYKTKSDKKDFLSLITNYKDSLIFYSDFNNIYYETFKGLKVDTIQINASLINQIIPNNNCVIAVGYSLDERELSIKSSNILFIDLKSKNRIKPDFNPLYLVDWSPDGKNLIVLDSVYRIIKYPELAINTLDCLNDLDSLRVQADLKYLNDSLIVFSGKRKNISYFDEQIYLYNLYQQKIVKKLPTVGESKEIFDVFSQ